METGVFSKKFQEGFFLTEPEVFILNHFPEESKWQLLPKMLTFESFASFPFIHDGYYDYLISDFSPKTAFVNSKMQFADVQLFFRDLVPEIVVFENGKLINVKKIAEGKTLKLIIPVSGKVGKHIIIGVKNNNYFDPVIEYKIR
jgi:hypothetical protein